MVATYFQIQLLKWWKDAWTDLDHVTKSVIMIVVIPRVKRNILRVMGKDFVKHTRAFQESAPAIMIVNINSIIFEIWNKLPYSNHGILYNKSFVSIAFGMMVHLLKFHNHNIASAYECRILYSERRTTFISQNIFLCIFFL